MIICHVILFDFLILVFLKYSLCAYEIMTTCLRIVSFQSSVPKLKTFLLVTHKELTTIKVLCHSYYIEQSLTNFATKNWNLGKFSCLILHGVKIFKYILETNIMKWALVILIVLIVLIVNMADSEETGKK